MKNKLLELKTTIKNMEVKPIIFYFITILYLEIFIKGIVCGKIFDKGLIYLLIYTLPIVLFINIITKLGSNKINKIISFIITIILTIYFETQYIFYTLFSVPFSFSTIGLADQALDFTTIIKDTILTHFVPFLGLLLPLIILIIIRKKLNFQKYNKYKTISLIIMLIISYISTFIFLLPSKEEYGSSYKLYYQIDDSTSIIDRFGMLTYLKIDIKRQIFGYEAEIITEDVGDIPKKESEKDQPKEKEYGDNKLEIDFSTLESKNKNIQSLNNYFSQITPTKKNEYTGMFKGKNLIFILAEGFNEIAVDENRTPTLYKLVNNGFVFNDFYSPVFLSTTGGEFQATTGLIPTQETLKLWKSNTPEISFALGNAFGNIGYRVQSFHDWTYSYYKRNITMKTLGFNNYLGCGNGLEKRMNCGWLPFDSEMVEATTKDYLGQEGNFVTYYVTVSGHSPYNVNDNIARNHFDTVENLEYSSSVKYYLASQVELDKMLEALIAKLQESDELDNTVIALAGDHYPYTLSTDEVNEVATYEKDGVMEINHSNLILWNNAMEEPIKVDNIGSQIDILPTLLNLFGIDYDSRLIIGRDILSNTEGLVIFSNRSWVTEYGKYDAINKQFTPKPGKEIEDVDTYIARINQRVSNAFSISKLLVETNYYKYVLNK